MEHRDFTLTVKAYALRSLADKWRRELRVVNAKIPEQYNEDDAEVARLVEKARTLENCLLRLEEVIEAEIADLNAKNIEPRYY